MNFEAWNPLWALKRDRGLFFYLITVYRAPERAIFPGRWLARIDRHVDNNATKQVGIL